MTGKKPPNISGEAKRTLAENVQRLLGTHYAESTNRPRALSEDAKVSFSTVQRVLAPLKAESPEDLAECTAQTLDTVEAIAGVFNLKPYQLLVPGLDVSNPQSIHSAGRVIKKKAA